MHVHVSIICLLGGKNAELNIHVVVHTTQYCDAVGLRSTELMFTPGNMSVDNAQLVRDIVI